MTVKEAAFDIHEHYTDWQLAGLRQGLNVSTHVQKEIGLVIAQVAESCAQTCERSHGCGAADQIRHEQGLCK